MNSGEKLRALKPFLKWVGGKRQLIPEIEKYIPKKYSTYYEPFLGAGALFFHLSPKKAVVNDLNEELILTYNSIKNCLDELLKELKIHHINNSKEYFYKVRNWDRDKDFYLLPNHKRAARLIYMNKVVFNGLYRVNSKGFFNVPYGKYKNPNINNEELLRDISKYLNKSEIKLVSTDYKEAVKSVKKGDLIYFDPPYDPLKKTSAFTSYQKDGFNRDNQIELKKCADELVERGAKVILSNSNTDFIYDLYSNKNENAISQISLYDIHFVYASRHINSKHDGRGKIKELLIVSKDKK